MAENFSKEVKVIWDNGEGVIYRYANQMFVSHSGYKEFHLAFGHLAAVNTVNKTKEDLPNEVKVETLAKLVISPEYMKEFIDVLQKNYADYIEAKEKKTNGS